MNTSLMSANMVKEINEAQNLAFVSHSKWCGFFFQIIIGTGTKAVTGFSSKTEAAAALNTSYPNAKIIGKNQFNDVSALVSMYGRKYQDEGHARTE